MRHFESRDRRSVRSLATLVVSSVACTAAFAASADQGPVDTSSSPAAASDAIEEIVVTAERRQETVQKSSVPIQVVTGEELERSGVTQSTDLNRIAPGLQIGTGGDAPQIYIRGIGDFAVSALSNPAVAFNVDGVYVARPQGTNSEFYDLERMEILKGPQGTLYGRNATGGAINLITRAPTLEEFDGRASLELGNDSLKHFEGAVNIPLGATVAMRAAVNVVDRAGYLSDGTDDDVRQAGRIRLLWKPNEDFSALLNADFAHEGGHGPGYTLLPRPPGTGPWDSASSAAANAILTTTPPLGFLVPQVADDSFRNNRFWNVSAQLEWNLGFATLTVLPAYRNSQLGERNYPAGLRNTIPTATSHATSTEARLANSSERLKWVAGLYYFRENQQSQQEIFEGLLQDNINNYSPITSSYAAFGQATLSITDALRLIGGMRYTYEDQSLSGTIHTDSPMNLPPGTPLPHLLEAFGGKQHFSATTWKGGAEYDLTPQNMLYATASTGFKAGGFNQTVAPMATYRPEKLRAYEFGARNRFFAGRLQVNVEVFKWDDNDNQVAHVLFDPLGNVNLLTQNAGRASIKGANIDLQARVTTNDTVSLFTEYNDAVYRSFSYDSAYSIFGNPILNPTSTGCRIGAPFAGTIPGTMLATVDCAGFQLPRSSRWTAHASYLHEFDLANGAVIVPRINAQFASAQWLAVDFVPTERVGSYTIVDFDLTYTDASNRWAIAAFLHNAADRAAYSGGGEQAFVPQLVYATILPPRTFGIRADYNFH
jgi:iron complex outermembrane receptor protein